MDYLASGAELVIVRRQHRVNAEMELNPAFRDLDAALFPEQKQARVLEKGRTFSSAGVSSQAMSQRSVSPCTAQGRYGRCFGRGRRSLETV